MPAVKIGKSPLSPAILAVLWTAIACTERTQPSRRIVYRLPKRIICKEGEPIREALFSSQLQSVVTAA